MISRVSVTLLILATLSHDAYSVRVLMIMPGYSASHVMFHYGIAERMLKQGHNVTIWYVATSFFEVKEGMFKAPEGVVEIRTENRLSKEIKKNGLDAFEEMSYTRVLTQNMLAEFEDKLPILSEQKFDLLIAHIFNNFGSIVAHKLNITKTIYLMPGIFIIMESSAINLQLPVNPSYVVGNFGLWPSNMAFKQRLVNSFYLLAMKHLSPFLKEEDGVWLEVHCIRYVHM